MTINRLTKNITLRHLNAFVAVAQEGSFTRAAHRLCQTQSSVTGLIQQLETALGTTLLSRTSRRVSLTSIGQEFLPRVIRLLSDFDSAVGNVLRFSEQKDGQVKVAAALSAIHGLIAPAACSYSQKYPNVRLNICDDSAEKIQNLVAKGEVDFGLTSRWADVYGLECEPLVEDQFGILYGLDDKSIQLNNDNSISLSQVQGQRFVGVTGETGIMAVLSARADLPLEASTPFYEASSTAAQASMIENGLGIALLPALIAHRVRTPKLGFALLNDMQMLRSLCLITHQDHPLSPAAAGLAGEIRQYLKKAPLPEGCRTL